MKKVLSVILCFCFTFVLVGCGNTAEETTTESASADFVEVTLTSEKTEVTAGEDIAVVVNVKNAMYTACFDAYVYTSEELSYVSAETELIDSRLMLAANYMNDAVPYVAIRGIVATAYDIEDKNICTVIYKVPETAVSGDTYEVKVDCPVYQLATDSSGNDVYDVNETVVTNTLTFTVL